MAWRFRPGAIYDEYAQPVPPALTMTDRGVLTGVGDGTRVWHHCHLRGGAVVGRDSQLGKNVYVDDGAVVGDKGLKVDAGTFVVQVGKRKFARVTLGGDA